MNANLTRINIIKKMQFNETIECSQSLCFYIESYPPMYTIEVENIKCSGCVKSIKSSLLKIEGIENVEVDIDNELVHISGPETTKTVAMQKLETMGYPEKGHNSLIDKAKSYVSCAIGKINV